MRFQADFILIDSHLFNSKLSRYEMSNQKTVYCKRIIVGWNLQRIFSETHAEWARISNQAVILAKHSIALSWLITLIWFISAAYLFYRELSFVAISVHLS